MQIKATWRLHLTPAKMTKIKKRKQQLMLEKMWSKGNTPPLLMGIQIYTATQKISMVVLQKTGNRPFTSSSCTTLGHIPKRCLIILQGHLLGYVHNSLFAIARTWKNPRCPSTEEWIKKMWYTMEYYSAIKSKDTRKFEGRWTELEKNILGEVTQMDKDKHGMYSVLTLKCILAVK